MKSWVLVLEALMQLEFKELDGNQYCWTLNWRLITKIRGNYNIVDNKLNFIEAPNGKNPIGTATNPPNERDFTGITTSASFNGRVFMRSGVVGGSEETYADNYLYDDISQQFIRSRKDLTNVIMELM